MIKIISDSTCDLSKELLDRYDVDVIPLHIILGDEDFEDGVGISPDQIYQWSEQNNTVPKTAACTVERIRATFESHLKNQMEIICFSISSQMSSTNSAMHMAAQQLDAEDRISIIDSENLSTGVGLLVIAAAEMAMQGASMHEIAEHIESLKPRVRSSFVVDTLTYLHRGGRCSGLSALLGSTLKLHPQINVAEGKMSPGKKYRGKLPHVISAYVDSQRDALTTACKDRVFITHSGCEREIIDAVYAQLSALNHFAEIHITRAGGVISSHCGPGTLGVLYIAGE